MIFAVLTSAMLGQANIQAPKDVDHAAGWVGKTAKAVPLQSDQGRVIDLSKEFGKRPVVMVFYRGNWCPFCHRQIADLARSEAKFAAKGAIVYLISNEDAAYQESMRTNEKLGKSFVFLTDPKAAMASLYAGKYPQGYLKPATIVVGNNGKITFASSLDDFRNRPSAATILAAVSKFKK